MDAVMVAIYIYSVIVLCVMAIGHYIAVIKDKEEDDDIQD